MIFHESFFEQKVIYQEIEFLDRAEVDERGLVQVCSGEPVSPRRTWGPPHPFLPLTEQWASFFGIALIWDWNESSSFPVLWPLLNFPNLLTY